MITKLGLFGDKNDGTLKNVYDIGENKIIEMSLLNNKENMDVVCAPTHHFCNLGCKMCHLTNNKLNKKMIPVYKDDFLYCIIDTLSKNGKKRTPKKKLLISFMGVGEPLLNIKLIEDVFKSENILKEKFGYEAIGYAISTMMPNNNILELTKIVNENSIPLKVHFSLHNPIDEKRKELIPGTNVMIEEALGYLVNYRNTITKNEKIMQEYTKLHRTSDPTEIHYTLIKNKNDGDVEISKLMYLLKKYCIPIKFIKFNPTNDFSISERENYLVKEINMEIPDLRVKQYAPPGREIGSSCGEFTKHYYHEEIETPEQKNEFEIWRKNHLVVELN